MKVYVHNSFYKYTSDLTEEINNKLEKLIKNGATILNCTVQYVEYSWNFGSKYSYVITYEE